MTLFASPYDGYGRAPLRITLALVGLADTLVGAYAFAHTPVGPRTHPMASAWILALAQRPVLLAVLCAAAVVSFVRFARGPARAREGWVGLALLALMVEGHAALLGGPMRVFFASGTALIGWLCGLAYARLGRTSASDARREMLAEAGAVAGLSAMYVGACVSKLLTQGAHWIEPAGLRELIYAQQRLGTPALLRAYGHFVGEHALVARALATATLLIQAGAVTFGFTPRTRAVVGTLLLTFHLNVWLLTPILFPQAMLLLVVFSYPWPRWLRRDRGDALDDPPRGPHELRATLVGVGAIAAVLVLAQIPSVRRYTHLHHRPEVTLDPSQRPSTPPSLPAPPPPPRASTLALLDGLGIGSPLVGPWQVAAIRDSDAVEVTLARPGAEIRITVTPHGARSVPPPRSTPQHDLFYGTSTLDDVERDGLLNALAARVQHAETATTPQ